MMWKQIGLYVALSFLLKRSFASDEVACPKGTFLSPGEGSGTGLCVECQIGEFSWRLNSKKCDHCPAGSTSNEEHTTCVPCNPGSYGDQDGGGCKRCLEGEITNTARKVQCDVCMAGKTSNKKNTKCVDCPAGRLSYSKNEGCFDCDTGKYASSKGSDRCEDCLHGLFECDSKTGEPLVETVQVGVEGV